MIFHIRSKLFKYLVLTLFLGVTEIAVYSQNSRSVFNHQFEHAVKFYKAGNFFESEKILIDLLKTDQIETGHTIALNNMLGILSKSSGDYPTSINFYKSNLNLLYDQSKKDVTHICKTLNNIANVYTRQLRYAKAIEYYTKAIDIIELSDLSKEDKQKELQYLYYDLGIAYFSIESYQQAIDLYLRSRSIREELRLRGLDKVYFNLAKTYNKLGNYNEADICFKKALKLRSDLFGPEYHRLGNIYMFYGDFLRQQGNFKKANKNLQTARNIYLKTYGKRHSYTANSHIYLGDYYSSVQNYDSALYCYQQSLISNSQTFSSNDIYKNPTYEDCISGLRLLQSLKKKSNTLKRLADRNMKDMYKNVLKTVDFALDVVSELRIDLIDESSKLIITEEERECYEIAVETLLKLYELEHDDIYLNNAFYYASKSKSSVLNTNMAFEKKVNKIVVDSLKEKKNNLDREISAYKQLIYKEQERPKPKKEKIQVWRSKLFSLNNEYEDCLNLIKTEYDINNEDHLRTYTVAEVSDLLPSETTLLEYFITLDEESDSIQLHTFIIHKDGFQRLTTVLNKDFFKAIQLYTKRMELFDPSDSDMGSFNTYIKASNTLYKYLIEPAEDFIHGNNLIIVPDGEMSYISFDALIKDVKEYSNINYADLDYLIYDYCISYAYSTSSLFNAQDRSYSDKVYAFAPNYYDDETVLRDRFGSLHHTQNEIESILTEFEGEAFFGDNAKESSFKDISGKTGILHFAMHAVKEETQNDFSFLAFSDYNSSDTPEDGFLYAYEIEKMNINSPLVVLSACNTGTGKFYSGEGVMSVARSFLKAEVPAVVNTLWKVNDEAGSMIMADFYRNLSEGMSKNSALRQAKLKYMKESSPAMVNPVYWSSYVLTGDVSPVKRKAVSIYVFIFLGLLIGMFFVVKLTKTLKKQKAL